MPGIPKTTGTTTVGRPQWTLATAALVDLAPDRGLEKDQEEGFQDPDNVQLDLAPDHGLENNQEKGFQDPDNVQ